MVDGIWAAVIWVGLTHSHIHTHNGEHDMNNANTQNIATITDTFRTGRDTRWARAHKAECSDLVFRNRFGMLGDYQKHAFYTLSLLNDIATNTSCDRALWVNITYWITRLEDILTGEYYAKEVIQDIKRALDVWHAHSPNRSFSGALGPITEECLAARADLAVYALQLLNYEMGRIDCGTIDRIVRASVGE